MSHSLLSSPALHTRLNLSARLRFCSGDSACRHFRTTRSKVATASGVFVCENGKGSVVDNDIFANQMAGVAIGRGGASRVTGNVIRDGNGGSLCLSAHSRGLISANVIHQDPRAAMQVPEGLMPEVKEHNLIRYSDPESAEYPLPAVESPTQTELVYAGAASGSLRTRRPLNR